MSAAKQMKAQQKERQRLRQPRAGGLRRRWRRRAGRGAGRGRKGRERVWSILEGREGGRSLAWRLEGELCTHGIRKRRGSRGHLGKLSFKQIICCWSR